MSLYLLTYFRAIDFMRGAAYTMDGALHQNPTWRAMRSQLGQLRIWIPYPKITVFAKLLLMDSQLG